MIQHRPSLSLPTVRALFLPYLHVSILHSESSTLFLDPVDGKGMSLICHCVNSHQCLTGDSNDRKMVFLSQPAHYSGQKEVWATACLLLVDLWMHIKHCSPQSSCGPCKKHLHTHVCVPPHVILFLQWFDPNLCRYLNFQMKTLRCTLSTENCIFTILRSKFPFFNKDIPLASPQYCSKPPTFE